MTDYTSLSRSDWLNLADTFYASLDRDLSSFGEMEWQRRSPYLGWRARDLLAHMTSAMPVNFRQVLDRALQDDPSPPPEFNTFTRNAREVARYQAISVQDILDGFRSELEAILDVYRHMSDADWLKPAWFFVGPVNVRTLFLVQLGDNLIHKRDLLLINGGWQGLDAGVTEPLMDWFMRELRPANFRPDQVLGLRAQVVYRLSGVGAGEWTFHIADGACRAEAGAALNPDIIIEADTEDLIVAAQARPAPIVGAVARLLEWVRGPDRKEDVVAGITGLASFVSAVATRRIRVTGDRTLVNKVNHAFWHFWERTEQTEHNIRLATVRA